MNQLTYEELLRARRYARAFLFEAQQKADMPRAEPEYRAYMLREVEEAQAHIDRIQRLIEDEVNGVAA